jgi:hypothetical protein
VFIKGSELSWWRHIQVSQRFLEIFKGVYIHFKHWRVIVNVLTLVQRPQVLKRFFVSWSLVNIGLRWSHNRMRTWLRWQRSFFSFSFYHWGSCLRKWLFYRWKWLFFMLRNRHWPRLLRIFCWTRLTFRNLWLESIILNLFWVIIFDLLSGFDLFNLFWRDLRNRLFFQILLKFIELFFRNCNWLSRRRRLLRGNFLELVLIVLFILFILNTFLFSFK